MYVKRVLPQIYRSSKYVVETLISAAGQSRSRSWRKCADIIGRTVLKFHERSRHSNFIFLAHFRLLFTLSITLTALQALFLATFQKTTPSYVTSDYVAFLALYWLYKVNKVMCDFPDALPHSFFIFGVYYCTFHK